MKAARLVVVAAIIFGSAAWLHAQTAPNLENGWKPYGSYDGSHLDTVNLMNGNLMLHAPLLPGIPQRGAASLQETLFVTSKNWQAVCKPTTTGLTTCSWQSGGTGVDILLSPALTVHRTLNKQYSGGEGITTYVAYGYSLVGADGSTHQMHGVAGSEDSNGAPTKFDSMDLTGYHMEMSNSDSNGILDTFTITDRQGNQYQGIISQTQPCGRAQDNGIHAAGSYPPMTDDSPMGDQYCSQTGYATLFTDSNGNQMNLRGHDSATLDTMGRLAPLFVSGPAWDPTDSSGCSLAHPFVSSTVYYYNAPDGSLRSIKECVSQINIQTAFNRMFGGYPIAEFSCSTLAYPGCTAITTIILGDGTKWSFDYDTYGELASVGLPTGGSISYGWTTIDFPNCNPNSVSAVSRAVTTRTLNDGQGHSYTWNYSWGTLASGSITNRVTDPLLNDTVHTFTAQIPPGSTSVAGCNLYETTTVEYQGAQAANHPLQRSDTTYISTYLTEDIFGAGGGVGNVFASDVVTTVYPSGKVKKVHKDPDTGLGAGKPIFGDVKKELEYDWGQGAPGALLRETDTTYQWETNSAYLTAHLLDLPSSVIVKDGGNNRVAETDYTYDEPAYLTTPNPAITTQHNSAPPYGVRGNQTTVSRWLNTTNSSIASHTNWYDTGEVYKAIDPLGHETTHSYDPFYAGAYGTQTCSPATSGVAHCVSGTYDFNTGVLTSLTNENATTQASGNTQGDSAHTSSYTYDYMFRITSAQAPPDPANNGLRATTNFNFSAPNASPITVQRSKSITTALSDSATSYFDGLGRGYQSQHAVPGNTATVDTAFDAAGHAATVSNPYFTTSDPTYGNTTNTYDGLDRVTQTTKQDGSISRVAYNVVTGIHDPVPGANTTGDCTDTTDEAGKKKRACTDGLGRLVMVVEPNPGAAATVSTGSISITGALKSQSGVGAVGSSTATAQVAISGSQQAKSVPAPPCDPGTFCDNTPQTYLDNGKVFITINGHEYDYWFPRLVDGDNDYLVASGLVSAIQADAARVVNASLVPNTATIQLTALNAGSAGNNISFVTGYTWDTSNFATPSFTTSPASGHLSGGVDSYAGVTVYDAGTVTVTVNSSPAFTASASYGASPGNSTPSLITSVLAGTGATGLNRPGSPVSATANGANVTITFLNPGATGDVSVSISSSSTQTAYSFSPPSFSGTGAVLGSGYDASDIDNNPYRTLYSYDTLGNLLRVDQKGSAPTDSTQWRTRTFVYDSLSRLLTANNPESGTISYTYDDDGNLLQKTSPAPNPNPPQPTQTVSYCYDESHRVTGKGYGAQSCPLATPVVTYAYDSGVNAKGHLTSLLDQAGTASYSYDILGRLATETRTLTGANNASISKNLSYEYNLDGSLSKLHYPSGAVLTYTPDSAGRTLSAVDGGSGINYVTGATYGPDSALTGFVSGSGGPAAITSSFTYNKRLQPLTMSATTPSQTVYSIGYDFHLGNGDNGNVFGITNYKDQNRNQTFTYDFLNRLTSAQNAGTDCTAKVLQNKTEYWGNSYGYDAWGNLLQKTITKCGAENLSVTADAHNWLHASGTDYQYDAAGNMTYDATASLSYTFDQENRLTGAAGYTYTYDGDGNRVRKSNGTLAANGTLYWYMTPGVVAESDLAGTLKSEYVFFDGERVARRDGPTGSGGVFYYFSDHLKTASVITDSAGVIKAESDYYPWGGELQFVNNDSNDYKFTGKKRDLETGLDYFGARYYSNGLGRWVSADWSATPVPVPYADFGDPQTLNLYQFVGGNPASKADPDGHWPTLQELKTGIEHFAETHPDAVNTTLKGIAAATFLESVKVVAGATALVSAPVGATVFAATHPTPLPQEGCMAAYCDMYVMPAPSAQGQNQQGQTQNQGQTQETAPTPDPAPAGGGNMKKGGGKAYDDTPENRARIAQGKPPIGKDGKPVELHSPSQTHKDQSQEITQTAHRGKGNFAKNHPNTGQQPSKVDRNQAARDRRAHWKKVHEENSK